MFVFEAVDTSFLKLVDVATKAEVPFDEYVVVAGRMRSLHQLTCIGGHAKRDGKRRLLVIPLAQTLETAVQSVQVLDVGEVAVNFLQGVRACFPTLVRKNLNAPPTNDSESDSDQEEANKNQEDANNGLPTTNSKEESSKAEAKEYMSRIRVKVLATLTELFSAFQILDPANVQTSLRDDPSVPKDCQLLCIECPPLAEKEDLAYAAVPHAFSSSTALPKPLNFGVSFMDLATRTNKAPFLRIPLPRSPLPGGQRGNDSQQTFQDATVLTFGTKREATAHGGGKTCEEMVKNIRMRHASGTFCTLVLPAKTWEQVAEEYKTFLPQVSELQGELRLRRFVGHAPSGAPIELLLEK